MRIRLTLPLRWMAVTLAALSLSVVLGACGKSSNSIEPIGPSAETGPHITGVVRAQGGAGVADAVVTLDRLEGGVAASVQATLVRAKAAARGVASAERVEAITDLRSAVTDAQGRYTFPGVEPGDYVLTGTRTAHQAGVVRVRVPASPTAVNVDILLIPTGSFHGVATLENANNHQSTVVYVEGTSFVAVTDPAGGYVIRGVPQASWAVHATHSRYIDQSTTGAIVASGDSIALGSMFLRLDSNIPPVATAVPPTQATESSETAFAGSGTDADGAVVRYEWDFENDGVFDYSSPISATTTHTYPAPGSYIAKLRVTDDQGAIGLAALPITVQAAVYVSSTTGAPGNPGTKLLPASTIQAGMTLAVSGGKSVIFVANGTYSAGGTLVLYDGKSILAGFDPVTWVRGSTLSTISLGMSALQAFNFTSTTEIERLHILTSGSGGPGFNSIAMLISNCNSNLKFRDCVFESGLAGQGAAGSTQGAAGIPGSNGAPGNGGSCDWAHGTGGLGGASSAGCPGGAGGRGGLEGANSGQPGFAGLCSGGPGGSPGPGGDPGLAGGNGTIGLPGNAGSAGATASTWGTLTGPGIWTPSVSGSGTAGTNGSGGGGGGGGGGQGGTLVDDGGGNGGGGGGGAGSAGGGGSGGSTGAASLAVILYNSSPFFYGCTFRTGLGGAGGAGRNGGAQAPGGSGGAGAAVCLSEIGRGGNGASGGSSGAGGAGAGGHGGVSVGILRNGASVLNLSSPVFNLGTGGAGGAGGSGAGSGQTGLSTNSLISN